MSSTLTEGRHSLQEGCHCLAGAAQVADVCLVEGKASQALAEFLS